MFKAPMNPICRRAIQAFLSCRELVRLEPAMSILLHSPRSLQMRQDRVAPMTHASESIQRPHRRRYRRTAAFYGNTHTFSRWTWHRNASWPDRTPRLEPEDRRGRLVGAGLRVFQISLPRLAHSFCFAIISAGFLLLSWKARTC